MHPRPELCRLRTKSRESLRVRRMFTVDCPAGGKAARADARAPPGAPPKGRGEGRPTQTKQSKSPHWSGKQLSPVGRAFEGGALRCAGKRASVARGRVQWSMREG